MKFWNASIMLAAVIFGGCATKQEIHTLHGDVGMMQQEWQAFRAAYDPAMQEELRRNLEVLRERNAEIALLRDESRRNTDRVAELLAQIDHNVLDQAIVECRRTTDESAHFAEMSQQNAQMALGYAEEMRHMTHQAIRHHEEVAHRVDTEALRARIRSLEKQIRRLEKALERQSGQERREEHRERSGR
jgi:polyhydroxyalkanoate synthesis regulator phasin